MQLQHITQITQAHSTMPPRPLVCPTDWSFTRYNLHGNQQVSLATASSQSLLQHDGSEAMGWVPIWESRQVSVCDLLQGQHSLYHSPSLLHSVFMCLCAPALSTLLSFTFPSYSAAMLRLFQFVFFSYYADMYVTQISLKKNSMFQYQCNVKATCIM